MQHVTLTLTLKALTTLIILRRFTYHRLALRVSSGVSVWIGLLPGFRNDLIL